MHYNIDRYVACTRFGVISSNLITIPKDAQDIGATKHHRTGQFGVESIYVAKGTIDEESGYMIRIAYNKGSKNVRTITCYLFCFSRSIIFY